MVSPAPERKNQPEYSLEAVHRNAGFMQVIYSSDRVQRHIENLDLSLDDVCVCLGSLQAGDFAHSERYDEDQRWHDVYKLKYRFSDEQLDDLYIKFRLTGDCVYIDLCSFHPEGWQ
jgi:MqsR (Motility quorum-sensing regulator) toxin of toxin-antitoxin system